MWVFNHNERDKLVVLQNRRFDVILFDLEGTLVDFQWHLDEAVQETVSVLHDFDIHIGESGIPQTYASLYNTTRQIVRARAGEDEARLFEILDRIYERYDADALSRWSLYEGTLKTLERLQKNGYRMGLVSNCGSRAVRAVLERFQLAHYFEVILTRDDISYLKPHPEGLQRALAMLDISNLRVLFVGDSPNDILAARRVPVQSCFLLGGESRVKGHIEPKAEFQIAAIAELADILTKGI